MFDFKEKPSQGLLLDKQGKPIIIRRAQALVLELADRHG
jgi:hypothetical protein